MVTVTLYDGTGYMDLAFFNQPWIASMYREGMELAVSGTVATYRGKFQMKGFDVEILRAEIDIVHSGRITPVHPATEGITTRTIRELMWRALDQLEEIPDPLPGALRGDLPSEDEALRAIHFPESEEQLLAALQEIGADGGDGASLADLGLDFGGAIEPDGDPSPHESGEATEIPEIRTPLDDETA